MAQFPPNFGPSSQAWNAWASENARSDVLPRDTKVERPGGTTGFAAEGAASVLRVLECGDSSPLSSRVAALRGSSDRFAESGDESPHSKRDPGKGIVPFSLTRKLGQSPNNTEFITKRRKYENSKGRRREFGDRSDLQLVLALVFRVFVLSRFRDYPIMMLKSPYLAKISAIRNPCSGKRLGLRICARKKSFAVGVDARPRINRIISLG